MPSVFNSTLKPSFMSSSKSLPLDDIVQKPLGKRKAIKMLTTDDRSICDAWSKLRSDGSKAFLANTPLRRPQMRADTGAPWILRRKREGDNKAGGEEGREVRRKLQF